MRKTIAIKALLKTINFNLQRMDKHATIDYKRAMCDAIESALFATGNYQGFKFIKNDDSEIDTLGYYSRQYFGH
tara:strand:- start:280 stop:501 length:222 start_codon:yes stop_codon:yes gene_type:complete